LLPCQLDGRKPPLLSRMMLLSRFRSHCE
jgi:hypothetical protein